jgi:hypothetical protein
VLKIFNENHFPDKVGNRSFRLFDVILDPLLVLSWKMSRPISFDLMRSRLAANISATIWFRNNFSKEKCREFELLEVKKLIYKA